MRSSSIAGPLLVVSALAFAACQSKSKNYTTNVELMQVRVMGQASASARPMDIEMKFVDCPGNARKVIRAERAFYACGGKFKAGDKLSAEVKFSYNSERGQYRDELVKLGDCPIKIDTKDEANYSMVENCKDVEATGLVVGVRCDRTRSPELVAKCPWFERK